MQERDPECSVIIPVYNKWELTRDCLASLRKHSAGHDLEVIVVDNGSSDATARELVPFGKICLANGSRPSFSRKTGILARPATRAPGRRRALYYFFSTMTPS